MDDSLLSYHIVALLGRGGSGRVFRARLEGAEGFARDVAIKFLSDADPDPELLARFRDESRILGLVQDRAVVRVEAPTRLDGHWAIVMEYVPGASCGALLRGRGPIPPRAALEIVQEVARALDHLYNHPDPQGRPLQLIHRDIKPSNIQITNSGEVKLLDFGVAQAHFDARESLTSTHSIQGTDGYIAPERMKGVDLPASDVYSLGMVLYKIITDGPTTRRDMAAARDQAEGPLQTALGFALYLTNADPRERPTAREVEGYCRELVARMDGPTLRDWAERQVPQGIGSTRHPLCGQVVRRTPLSSSMAVLETGVMPAPRSTTMLTTLTVVNLLLLLSGVVAAVALVGWVGFGPEPEAPAEAVEAGTTTWQLGSEPSGAEVLVDGALVGKTPLTLEMEVGLRDVEMRLGEATSQLSIDVRGVARKLSWNQEIDGWTNVPVDAVVEPLAPVAEAPAPKRRPRKRSVPRPKPSARPSASAGDVAAVVEPEDDLPGEAGEPDVVEELVVAEAVLDVGGSDGTAEAEEEATGPTVQRVPFSEVRVRYLEQPDYPNAARSMGLGEQHCRVTVQVDAEGAPDEVRVQGCPPMFHDEVRRAMQRSRWRPYKVDGEAVPVLFTFLLTFRPP